MKHHGATSWHTEWHFLLIIIRLKNVLQYHHSPRMPTLSTKKKQNPSVFPRRRVPQKKNTGKISAIFFPPHHCPEKNCWPKALARSHTFRDLHVDFLGLTFHCHSLKEPGKETPFFFHVRRVTYGPGKVSIIIRTWLKFCCFNFQHLSFTGNRGLFNYIGQTWFFPDTTFWNVYDLWEFPFDSMFNGKRLALDWPCHQLLQLHKKYKWIAQAAKHEPMSTPIKFEKFTVLTSDWFQKISKSNEIPTIELL